MLVLRSLFVSLLFGPWFQLYSKQFFRETQLNLDEVRNARNEIQAYQKQIAALKKDILGLRGRNNQITQLVHEKDYQIQQLKKILSRSTEKKFRSGVRERQPVSEFAPTLLGIPQSQAPASGERHQESAAFHNYVRKKEKGEMAQERDLIVLTRKKIPI